MMTSHQMKTSRASEPSRSTCRQKIENPFTRKHVERRACTTRHHTPHTRKQHAKPTNNKTFFFNRRRDAAAHGTVPVRTGTRKRRKKTKREMRTIDEDDRSQWSHNPNNATLHNLIRIEACTCTVREQLSRLFES